MPLLMTLNKLNVINEATNRYFLLRFQETYYTTRHVGLNILNG